MSLRLISCIALLMLTSCAKQSTKIKVQLTAEQKARQTNILDKLLETREPSKLVGRNKSDYSELFELAEVHAENEKSSSYGFYLENISNPEGPGTLIIRTMDGRITSAEIIFPEW